MNNTHDARIPVPPAPHTEQGRQEPREWLIREDTLDGFNLTKIGIFHPDPYEGIILVREALPQKEGAGRPAEGVEVTGLVIDGLAPGFYTLTKFDSGNYHIEATEEPK